MFFRLFFVFAVVLGAGPLSAKKGCIDLFSSAGIPLEPAKNSGPLKPQKKTRYSKKEKELLSQTFFDFFYKKDKRSIKSLVSAHPFLRNARTPLPLQVLNSSAYRSWFDLEAGWTPLQIAAYNKDLDLLKFLLDMGFNYRAKKERGGVSTEYNPLHIAISADFKKGAESILQAAGLQKFKEERGGNRFIDEKTGDKQTPWALAVFKDVRNKTVEFIPLIGKYEPSGYVESYILNEPMDGYLLAERYGGPGIHKLALKYLKAPNYDKYMEIKNNSINNRRKRTKPRYMY